MTFVKAQYQLKNIECVEPRKYYKSLRKKPKNLINIKLIFWYVRRLEIVISTVMYLLALNLDAVWIDLDAVDIDLDTSLCSADADAYTNSFISLIN